MHPLANPVRSFLLIGVMVTSGAIGTAQSAGGDEGYGRPVDRRFTYLQETLHGASPGHFEYEQWLTWKTHTRNETGFNRLDVKHELEYGISDGVHFAIDFAEWHWQDSASQSATRFDLTAAELKFRILDPRTEAVGLGFKTELGVGPVGLEWENVLIVDKIIDRWDIAYNLLVGAGWDGDKLFEFKDSDGEVTQSLGVSRELSPTLFLGAELVYETPLPGWHSSERGNLFLGPNLAFHGREWALTTTPLFLLSGSDDEPLFQWRVIFELDF